MTISGIYRKNLLLSPFSLVTDLPPSFFAHLLTVKCLFSCILPRAHAVKSTKTQEKPFIPSLSKNNNLQSYNSAHVKTSTVLCRTI